MLGQDLGTEPRSATERPGLSRSQVRGRAVNGLKSPSFSSSALNKGRESPVPLRSCGDEEKSTGVRAWLLTTRKELSRRRERRLVLSGP